MEQVLKAAPSLRSQEGRSQAFQRPGPLPTSSAVKRTAALLKPRATDSVGALPSGAPVRPCSLQRPGGTGIPTTRDLQAICISAAAIIVSQDITLRGHQPWTATGFYTRPVSRYFNNGNPVASPRWHAHRPIRSYRSLWCLCVERRAI